jgi:nicotinamidase-related amidase
MIGGALRIEPPRAGLLIIDVQERLAGAMQPEAMAAVERNSLILVEAACRFELPIVVSQQYPKGLGSTIEPLATRLESASSVHRFDKVEFSVCGAEAFPPISKELGREQWIVIGMETHVCVYQTVRDLVASGSTVFVPVDAVASRTDSNRLVGLELMSRAGAVRTCTETVVFDLLGKAGGEDFKVLSKMIR